MESWHIVVGYDMTDIQPATKFTYSGKPSRVEKHASRDGSAVVKLP